MKKLKTALLIFLSLVFIGCDPAFAKEEETPDQTLTEYCEEVYWEDEYNCTPPTPDVITKEFCLSLQGADEIDACLALVKEDKKELKN